MRKRGLAERERRRWGRGGRVAGVVKEPLFSPEELSQLWAGPIVARADGIACQVFPTAFPARGKGDPPGLWTWWWWGGSAPLS